MGILMQKELDQYIYSTKSYGRFDVLYVLNCQHENPTCKLPTCKNNMKHALHVILKHYTQNCIKNT